MRIVSELEKLDEMHRSGVLSDEEFTQAKTHLLQNPEGVSSALTQQQMAVIELRLDRERIEREWLAEQEKHMLVNRYGGRSLPKESDSFSFIGPIILIVIVVIFAILSTGRNLGIGFLFAIPGVCGIVAICVVETMMQAKAQEYRKAKEQYLHRRSELERRLEEAKREAGR